MSMRNTTKAATLWPCGHGFASAAVATPTSADHVSGAEVGSAAGAGVWEGRGCP